MWSLNLKSGTIWSVKSINQYDEIYEGMSNGTKDILILSVFTDPFGKEKITYIKLDKYKKPYKQLITFEINDKYYWFDTENLFTGDRRCLESYIATVPKIQFNLILKYIRGYFNLENKEPKIKESTKNEEDSSYQRRIYKFGIDVYVTENENVTVTENNKILLSDSAKEDIIYNSKTDEDLRILCDKYKIYPIKAIKEIRNRLSYPHRQKNK